MRELPHLNEKNKEKPLCYAYSIKARALIHAHLSRLELNPNTLDKGKIFIVFVKNCACLSVCVVVHLPGIQSFVDIFISFM